MTIAHCIYSFLACQMPLLRDLDLQPTFSQYDILHDVRTKASEEFAGFIGGTGKSYLSTKQSQLC